MAETGLARDKSLSIALGCTVASYTRGQAAQFAFTVAIAKVWVWVEAVAWVGVPALIALSLVQALARARLHNDTTTPSAPGKSPSGSTGCVPNSWVHQRAKYRRQAHPEASTAPRNPGARRPVRPAPVPDAP